MKFNKFNLSAPVLEGIDAMGFEKPSPIQEQAIPIIMEGKDLIACAQTGTGKTAAFLLPMMDSIVTEEQSSTGIKALIVAPTRELAIQIDQQLEGFSYFTNISSIAVYGGGSGALFEQEKKALQSGADLVVATPGRLLSHLNLGYVDFSDLRFLVLDEADRMLDMGFLPDISRIISYLPTDRQTLLFSATMPDGIRKLAEKILKSPAQINLAVSKPAENVLQAAYIVHDDQKIALISHLITGRDLPLVLIFASTKQEVKEVEKALKRLNMNAKAIHSDLEQEERGEVMNQFKSRSIQILVATDIVSRGIDVDDISLVINYNVPGDAEDYVHRVGRTARAERSGLAITFVSPAEYRKFRRIEDVIQTLVRKMPVPDAVGEGPSLEELENRNKSASGQRKQRGNFKKPNYKKGKPSNRNRGQKGQA